MMFGPFCSSEFTPRNCVALSVKELSSWRIRLILLSLEVVKPLLQLWFLTLCSALITLSCLSPAVTSLLHGPCADIPSQRAHLAAYLRIISPTRPPSPPSSSSKRALSPQATSSMRQPIATTLPSSAPISIMATSPRPNPHSTTVPSRTPVAKDWAARRS